MTHLIEQSRDFVQSIEEDFNKRIKNDIAASKITSLVITYGVNKKIPNNKYAFVKYAGRHNGLLKEDFNNSEKVDKVIVGRIGELLNKGEKPLYKVENIAIAKASSFMNNGMNLYAYLITQNNQI